MDADLIDSHLQWAKAEGDVVTVGITDHAQAELGDVVYVELPEVVPLSLTRPPLACRECGSKDYSRIFCLVWFRSRAPCESPV